MVVWTVATWAMLAMLYLMLSVELSAYQDSAEFVESGVCRMNIRFRRAALHDMCLEDEQSVTTPYLVRLMLFWGRVAVAYLWRAGLYLFGVCAMLTVVQKLVSALALYTPKIKSL